MGPTLIGTRGKTIKTDIRVNGNYGVIYDGFCLAVWFNSQEQSDKQIQD